MGMCRQRRHWDTVQDRIETGMQSARRVDINGFGSKVQIKFSKESPSADQVFLSFAYVRWHVAVLANQLRS